MHRTWPLVASAAVACALPSPTRADPGGDLARLVPVVAADEPVELAFRRDDPAMYVAQRRGVVLRAAGDDTTVALDLTTAVSTDGRNGLLGLAFSADGTEAYVHYSDAAGDRVVDAYPVTGAGAFDAESARTVITIAQPHANDRGGDLVVGPDGFLYIGSGDGGGDTDPDRAGQSLVTMLAKVLRLDPTPSADLGYTIPPDNPYTGLAGLLDELWALGVQDPRQFSFDPVTGDFWVADVGHRHTQEVSVDPTDEPGDAGRNTNFGWSAYEGELRINNDMTAETHRRPLLTYPNENGRCAISGGVRARGVGAGALNGHYVFADYCSGEVVAFDVTGQGEELAAGAPVTLCVTTRPAAVVAGPDGALYVLSADAVARIDVVGDLAGS